MKIKHLLLSCSLLLFFLPRANAQYLQQYFDGSDTSTYAILVHMDTSNHVWQIGAPHKSIFSSAATMPNALVTDTLNTYPSRDSSSFYFSFKPMWLYGILALRWKQKLDLDKGHDGGIIEYSKDTGHTWHNVFNDPNVYNFYGFDTLNKDTLASGDYAFSGTDTSWRDIWLCFNSTFLSTDDTVFFRFRLLTDSVDSAKEGWLIDNLLMHRTVAHTIASAAKEKEYVKVYPTVTTGVVNISVKKQGQYDKIEGITLISADGRVLKDLGEQPLQCLADISSYPEGSYFLKIRTNVRSVTMPVIIKK